MPKTGAVIPAKRYKVHRTGPQSDKMTVGLRVELQLPGQAANKQACVPTGVSRIIEIIAS
ncbi:hypothetical protein SAMN05216387_11315 [Nitrosovibrio tenuis]|uniref:Uncharacterized protein n=1 Tax=Nitrosovibrio tenuis TaxID=1233 RepID=A0A1H7QR40_9PROT|nr:hypothetical protein SAMN05216387_11315 [Nitrosovibrio tenuis]